MEDKLIHALEKLALEDAFRLLYGAYEYLRDLPGEVQSSSRALLHRIRANDLSAVLYCVRKMLEEQDEARLALEGRHVHEGTSLHETLVNELQQSIYWPLLLCVGRGVNFESVKAGVFLKVGLAYRDPEKSEYEEGKCDEVAVLRRVLVRAGQALTNYNNVHCHRIDPCEVLLTDLKQMAKKEYMAAYFEQAYPFV